MPADFDDVFAKPAPGRTVPLPDGTPWPSEGARVARDRYVRRRIADGDLVLCDPPLPKAGEGDRPQDGGGGDSTKKKKA